MDSFIQNMRVYSSSYKPLRSVKCECFLFVLPRLPIETLKRRTGLWNPACAARAQQLERPKGVTLFIFVTEMLDVGITSFGRFVTVGIGNETVLEWRHRLDPPCKQKWIHTVDSNRNCVWPSVFMRPSHTMGQTCTVVILGV